MANIISKIVTPNNANGYAVRSGFMYYGTTSGTGAAYTVTIQEATSPYEMIKIEGYYEGLTLAVRFHTAPTTASPTLNVNSISAVQIKYENSASPQDKIVPGAMYILVYATVGGTGYFHLVHSYDTFHSGKNVLTNTNIGTVNSSSATTNSTTYLNHVENGVVTTDGSIRIEGRGTTTVTAKAGVLTINSTGGGSGSGSPGKNVFTDSNIGTTDYPAEGEVYLNHVVGTQVTSSEMLTGGGDGIWLAEEGNMLHLYNTSRLSISTNATTIGTPDTGNSNTYLNYAFANPDDSLTVVDSIKIAGTGSTSVSYSNANKTLTINSTGGGGGGNTDLVLSQTNTGTVHVSTIPSPKVHLNYIVNGNVARSIPIVPGNGMISVPVEEGAIKIYGPETANVFSNSNIGTVNATVGASDTLYLNHVSNGFVVSSLAIVGVGPTITANNGVMTIRHSSGGGGGVSAVSFTEADFGVMGAFVGLLDVDGVQTPIAVEPARPDVIYDGTNFSRQGVVKPFVETRNAISAYHHGNDRHMHGVIEASDLDSSRVIYVDSFSIGTDICNEFIAIPVVFDYGYNDVTNRFESVPYVLFPNDINGTSLARLYSAGNFWGADRGEDDSTDHYRPTAPLVDEHSFDDGDIWDSYDPLMV